MKIAALAVWRLGAIVASLLLCSPADAADPVPGLIAYQGRVAVAGSPFTGTGQFKFALVGASGTPAYWSNDGTSVNGSEPAAGVLVAAQGGLFSVLLGDSNLANMTSVPSSVFTHQEVYLRLWFSSTGAPGSFELLSPDRRIAVAGYAMLAQDANALGGQDAAFYRDASNLNAGTVPAARLPAATTGSLGAVRPDGSTITVDANGVITAAGTGPHASAHAPGGSDALPWTTIHGSGTLAARPVAAATNAGYIYLATDVNGGTSYRSDGASWTQVAKGVSETATPASHTHPVADVSDSTATGRAVVTATDAAAARTAIGLGNVENTALSTWAGTTNVTTLGTIASGTWQGTAVGIAYGGTGATDAATARSNLGLGNVVNLKSNLTAVVDPTVNNDIDELYGIGSRWVNTATGKEFVCLSTTDGAASWKETTNTGLLVASSNLSDVSNAATARTNLGLGNVENTALSTWAGTTNVTTLGTVTTGTWNAGAVTSSGAITGVGAVTTGNATTAGSVVVSDGSSNTGTVLTSGLSADRTYTLPDATGTIALTSDITAAAGATKALDNLASVAVNTSLLPGVTNSIDLGDATHRWQTLHLGTSLVTPTTTLAAAELDRLDGKDADLLDTNDAVATAITGVGTITAGTWQGTVVGPTYGGTGVNNGANTITLGGNVSTAGAFTTAGANDLTLTTTGATNVTLPTTGTLATTSDKLSAFAATTSAELAGVISDETGTGALVFANTPTLVTPNIGAATGTSLSVTGGPLLTVAAATQDGVVLAGRAGGTNSYAVTLTPTTLTGNQTLTLPDATGTIALTSDITAAAGATKALDNLASVAVNTSLLPGVTNSIDLGDATHRWQTLHLGTSLVTPSATLTAAELDRLDGKDAALMDTNDAVATAITGVGTITAGTWQGTVVGPTYGGTGVNNGANTITLGGNVSTAGAFTTAGANALTLTTTGATNVTLPTTGTLATTSDKLSAFAATTSAELAGVISDETGSGALVFANTPTLVTPNIGAATGTSLSVTGGLTASNGAVTTGDADTAGSMVVSDGSGNTGTISTIALAANRAYTLPDKDGTFAMISDLPAAGIGGSIADTQVAYGSGTSIAGSANLVYTGGQLRIGGTGSLDINQGTAATAEEALNIATTWNDGADDVTFTAIKSNVTDTESNAASLLLDLQVGGASKFKVGKGGATTIADTTISSNAGTGALVVGGGVGVAGRINVAGAISTGGTIYSSHQINVGGIGDVLYMRRDNANGGLVEVTLSNGKPTVWIGDGDNGTRKFKFGMTNHYTGDLVIANGASDPALTDLGLIVKVTTGDLFATSTTTSTTKDTGALGLFRRLADRSLTF